MKTTIALLLIAVLVTSCFDTTAPAKPATQVVPPPTIEPLGPPLFVVQVGGKDGFINREGEIVIEPTFQKAYPFRDGLAAVQVGGLWGFIDTNGDFAIKPQFIDVGLFSEGLVKVRVKAYTDPWGYVDKTGKMVIEPQYDCADQFRNGIAMVGHQTSGSKVTSRIADVGIECDYHFIDRTGAIVADPDPTHYASGEAGELIPFTKDGLVGYVNAQGEVVIQPRFKAGMAFSDGLACALEDSLFGFIDKTGAWVISPRFAYASNFSEGLAGVPLGAKGWGFIDKAGEIVIPAKFSWVYEGFRHGIAKVVVDGKSGYVDKQGNWVWRPGE